MIPPALPFVQFPSGAGAPGLGALFSNRPAGVGSADAALPTVPTEGPSLGQGTASRAIRAKPRLDGNCLVGEADPATNAASTGLMVRHDAREDGRATVPTWPGRFFLLIYNTGSRKCGLTDTNDCREAISPEITSMIHSQAGSVRLAALFIFTRAANQHHPQFAGRGAGQTGIFPSPARIRKKRPDTCPIRGAPGSFLTKGKKPNVTRITYHACVFSYFVYEIAI